MSNEIPPVATFAIEVLKICGSLIVAVCGLWYWLLKIILRDTTNALVLDLQKNFASKHEFDALERRCERLERRLEVA